MLTRMQTAPLGALLLLFLEDAHGSLGGARAARSSPNEAAALLRCADASPPQWVDSHFHNATRAAMQTWTCAATRGDALDKQPSLEHEGFIVVKDLLTPREVRMLRRQILDATNIMLEGQAPFFGRFVPDPFDERFAAVRPVIEHVIARPALHHALRRAFRGARYVFTGMSDIQVNRSVHWHRDLVRPETVSKLGFRQRWARGLFARDDRGHQEFNLFRMIVYLQVSLSLEPNEQRLSQPLRLKPEHGPRPEAHMSLIPPTHTCISSSSGSFG